MRQPTEYCSKGRAESLYPLGTVVEVATPVVGIMQGTVAGHTRRGFVVVELPEPPYKARALAEGPSIWRAPCCTVPSTGSGGVPVSSS